MILAIVDDLIFLSKIQETAKRLNVVVRPVAPGDLSEFVGTATPEAAIIDLNHASGKALEVVRSLRATGQSRPLMLVGFASHVQTDLITEARQAGCDLVLPRSAFVRQLPDLLRQLTLK
jgi:CheY-like chemotaxis protein